MRAKTLMEACREIVQRELSLLRGCWTVRDLREIGALGIPEDAPDHALVTVERVEVELVPGTGIRRTRLDVKIEDVRWTVIKGVSDAP